MLKNIFLIFVFCFSSAVKADNPSTDLHGNAASVENHKTLTGLFASRPDALLPKTQFGYPNKLSPEICVGIRGNGTLLFAHFPAMARIVEDFGVIDGMAGGSSASLSLFLYDSILANPAVWKCGEERCSEAEMRARLAFLLKATPFILTAMAPDTLKKIAGQMGSSKKNNPEQMQQLLGWLKNGFPYPQARLRIVRNIIHRVVSRKVSEKLNEFLAKDGADLLSKDLVHKLHVYLQDLPAGERHEILRSLEAFKLNFEKSGLNGSDTGLLFRESLLNMPNAIRRVGRTADLLAGRGPNYTPLTESLLAKCAAASHGKTWEEFAQTPEGIDCAQSVASWISGYERYAPSHPAQNPRLKDFVGSNSNALIIAAVVHGDAVKRYDVAMKSHRRNLDAPINYKIDFTDEMGIGYWGRYSSLRNIDTGPKPSDDIRLQKFYPLGTTTWEYALNSSTLEPVIDKMRKIPANGIDTTEDIYTAGGWPDLQPSVVLKRMGCKHVVLINRDAPRDNNYSSDVAKLFGMDSSEAEKLFSLTHESGSFQSSMKATDAVLCTNWEKFTNPKQWGEMAADSYRAPLYTRPSDPFFAKGSNSVLSLPDNKPCCTPIE